MLLLEARFTAIANPDQVEDLREIMSHIRILAFARVVLADLLHYSGQAPIA